MMYYVPPILESIERFLVNVLSSKMEQMWTRVFERVHTYYYYMMVVVVSYRRHAWRYDSWYIGGILVLTVLYRMWVFKVYVCVCCMYVCGCLQVFRSCLLLLLPHNAAGFV